MLKIIIRYSELTVRLKFLVNEGFKKIKNVNKLYPQIPSELRTFKKKIIKFVVARPGKKWIWTVPEKMLLGRKRKTSPPLSSRILRKVKVSLQMEFWKFKGTVCVISTDSVQKWHCRFTTVPNCLLLFAISLQKWSRFLAYKKKWSIDQNLTLPHFWSDRVLSHLHRGSLEITITV